MRLTLPRERYRGRCRRRVLRSARRADRRAAGRPRGVRRVAVSVDGGARHAVHPRARPAAGRHAADGAHHRRDAEPLRDAARAAAGRPHLQPRRSSRRAAGRPRQPVVRGAIPARGPIRSASGWRSAARIAGGPTRRSSAWWRTSGTTAPTRPTRPEIYMPVRQQTEWNQLFLLVRGDGAAASLLPAVRGRGRVARSGTARLRDSDAGRGHRGQRRSSSASRRSCWARSRRRRCCWRPSAFTA